DFQRSGGLLQQQPVLQEVVARQRVLALGVEQVLLVDQHVDHGARADFEPYLRGLVGTAGRDQRQAPRLDFADPGDEGLVGIARVAFERTLLLFQFVGRDVALRDRLPDLGRDRTTRKDRNAQGQPEGRPATLATQRERTVEVRAGERGLAPGRALAVAAVEVERGV